MAFVPFALERHYEMWVMSKSCATLQDETHLDSMSVTLKQCLKMLYLLKNDSDYNLLVRQAAVNEHPQHGTHGHPQSSFYRWHICVIPHRPGTRWAGIKAYGGGFGLGVALLPQPSFRVLNQLMFLNQLLLESQCSCSNKYILELMQILSLFRVHQSSMPLICFAGATSVALNMPIFIAMFIIPISHLGD